MQSKNNKSVGGYKYCTSAIPELLDKKEIREEALLELGQLNTIGNLDEAIRIFETAKKECSNSDGGNIKFNNDISREKRNQKHFYTQNVVRKKRLHIVMAAYAYTLLAIEDTKGAIDIYMKLTKQSPLKSIYWLNLCACYRVEKKTETAIKVAKTGMIFNPGNKLLKQTLAQSYAEIGKDQQVRELIKDDLDDENISDQHMYNLQFLGEGYKLLASDALKKMAQKWEQRKLQNKPREMWRDRIRERNIGRKMRVGYLSADCNSHPVGSLSFPY